jgi:hypothetical protein
MNQWQKIYVSEIVQEKELKQGSQILENNGNKHIISFERTIGVGYILRQEELLFRFSL